MAEEKRKKTTKSAKPRKSVVAKKPEVAKEEKKKNITVADVLNSSKKSFPSLKSLGQISKVYLIAGIVILFLAVLIYLFKGSFVVATVNNEPITRLEMLSELEKQNGKQTLDQLITKSLILQEAKKKNVVISDQEVDQEIAKIRKNIEQQGQQLESLLSMQNMTMNDLREQIRIQMTINKLLGEVSVTDKEVDEYLAQNKDSIPESTDTAELKNSVKEQIKQQKLTDKYQTWIQGLREKSNIQLYRTY